MKTFYFYIYYMVSRYAEKNVQLHLYRPKNPRWRKKWGGFQGVAALGLLELFWLFTLGSLFEIFTGNDIAFRTPFAVFWATMLGLMLFNLFAIKQNQHSYHTLFSSWTPLRRRTWDFLTLLFILISFFTMLIAVSEVGTINKGKHGLFPGWPK